MNRRLTNISLLLCLTLACKAQDIHFSQFLANPLLVNPALTGNMECNTRANTVYRSQWKSVTIPYTEKAIYLEGKGFPQVLNHDWLGFGCYLNNTNAGDGALKNTTGMGFISFHKGLLKNNALFTSIGVGLGVFNKSIDLSKLLFDSQWDGLIFNPTQANKEPFRNSFYSRFDFNAGITITYSSEAKFGTPPFTLYGGMAMHHLNRPDDSFFMTNNKLGVKKVYHGGGVLKITDGIIVQPAFYITKQKNAKEVILGFNSLFFKGSSHLVIGIWSRLSRDIIPLVGMEWGRTTLSVSYDINISPLVTASGHRGGIEINLVKTFNCMLKRASPAGKNLFQYPNLQGKGPTKF